MATVDVGTIITDVEDVADAVETLLSVAEKYDGFLNANEQAIVTDIGKGAQWLLDVLHALPTH
jgi:hypothetical protein